VLAFGAVPRPALSGALTFRGPADGDAFRHVLDEADGGSVRSIVFALPTGDGWTLPLYELALLTASHLERRGTEIDLALVTPEPVPLSLFGRAAGDAVRELLREHRISLHTGCRPVRYEPPRLEIVPDRVIHADRVVALPRLEGPRILGVPQDADGFIATDLTGRVRGLTDVYAAGDITGFPIKQGGIAAQQADVVARAIAAEAGAAVQPQFFRPVLRGILLTGDTARFLRNEHGAESVTQEALWWPPTKIVGRYLAPFLADHAGIDLARPAGRTGALEIDIQLAIAQLPAG
jgi:sulfide:quinone oxidoreductase